MAVATELMRHGSPRVAPLGTSTSYCNEGVDTQFRQANRLMNLHKDEPPNEDDVPCNILEIKQRLKDVKTMDLFCLDVEEDVMLEYGTDSSSHPVTSWVQRGRYEGVQTFSVFAVAHYGCASPVAKPRSAFRFLASSCQQTIGDLVCVTGFQFRGLRCCICKSQE